MSNRAWMPLHVADYLQDTGHLTALEHGAYLLLIMHYWKDGGLPSDESIIRRIAKLSAAEWAESRDVLASLFIDGWRHKRIDAELAKADEIISKRRASGQQKGSKSSANAEQMLSIPAANADTRAGTPITNNLSEADASAADAAPDPRTRLFSEGLVLLTRMTGKTESAARQLLGRWLKEAADDCSIILDKLRTAERERIADPVSWMTAAIRPRPPPQREPRNVAELAMMKLSGAISHDHHSDTAPERLDPSDGRRQIAGSGAARQTTIATERVGSS